MALGPPGRRNEPLGVFWMVLALVAAAAFGGAAGLVWHWLGFGEEAPAQEQVD